MAYTINYNSEANIIETTFQGDFTFTEAKEFIFEAARIAKEKDCTLFLSDYRKVILKLSTMEIYKIPGIMRDSFASLGLNVNRLRRAVVTAKEADGFLFYETVTVNRGQQAKVFYDLNEAKNWLLG